MDRYQEKNLHPSGRRSASKTGQHPDTATAMPSAMFALPQPSYPPSCIYFLDHQANLGVNPAEISVWSNAVGRGDHDSHRPDTDAATGIVADGQNADFPSPRGYHHAPVGRPQSTIFNQNSVHRSPHHSANIPNSTTDTRPNPVNKESTDLSWDLVPYKPFTGSGGVAGVNGAVSQGALSGSPVGAGGMFLRSPTPTKRQRTSQACEKCRERKAKCNGARPTCQRCSNRGLPCEYAKERRLRGPSKIQQGYQSGYSSHQRTSSSPARSTLSKSSSTYTIVSASSGHAGGRPTSATPSPSDPFQQQGLTGEPNTLGLPDMSYDQTRPQSSLQSFLPPTPATQYGRARSQTTPYPMSCSTSFYAGIAGRLSQADSPSASTDASVSEPPSATESCFGPDIRHLYAYQEREIGHRIKSLDIDGAIAQPSDGTQDDVGFIGQKFEAYDYLDTAATIPPEGTFNDLTDAPKEIATGGTLGINWGSQLPSLDSVPAPSYEEGSISELNTGGSFDLGLMNGWPSSNTFYGGISPVQSHPVTPDHESGPHSSAMPPTYASQMASDEFQARTIPSSSASTIVPDTYPHWVLTSEAMDYRTSGPAPLTSSDGTHIVRSPSHSKDAMSAWVSTEVGRDSVVDLHILDLRAKPADVTQRAQS